MLAQLSAPLLGVRVSAKEVSNALHKIVPAAKAFLTRRLDDRKWMYLYIDGTNFRVRRSTVDIEPTLVVLGVDESGRKSVLSMMQGDKDSRGAWEAVFVDLKERGLDPTTVKAGIMDGLPGLGGAFREAFTQAVVLRCWVHKARNAMPRVPRRYQAAFMASCRTDGVVSKGALHKSQADVPSGRERDAIGLLRADEGVSDAAGRGDLGRIQNDGFDGQVRDVERPSPMPGGWLMRGVGRRRGAGRVGGRRGGGGLRGSGVVGCRNRGRKRLEQPCEHELLLDTGDALGLMRPGLLPEHAVPREIRFHRIEKSMLLHEHGSERFVVGEQPGHLATQGG